MDPYTRASESNVCSEILIIFWSTEQNHDLWVFKRMISVTGFLWVRITCFAYSFGYQPKICSRRFKFHWFSKKSSKAWYLMWSRWFTWNIKSPTPSPQNREKIINLIEKNVTKFAAEDNSNFIYSSRSQIQLSVSYVILSRTFHWKEEKMSQNLPSAAVVFEWGFRCQQSKQAMDFADVDEILWSM